MVGVTAAVRPQNGSPNQITEPPAGDKLPAISFADGTRAHGEVFIEGVDQCGYRDRPTSRRASPWQNGYAERLIGYDPQGTASNPPVVCSAKHNSVSHLLTLVKLKYYNGARTHLIQARKMRRFRAPSIAAGHAFDQPGAGTHHKL